MLAIQDNNGNILINEKAYSNDNNTKLLLARINILEKEVSYLHDEIKELFSKGKKRLENN